MEYRDAVKTLDDPSRYSDAVLLEAAKVILSGSSSARLNALAREALGSIRERFWAADKSKSLSLDAISFQIGKDTLRQGVIALLALDNLWQHHHLI
jgi:hypothetical protein